MSERKETERVALSPEELLQSAGERTGLSADVVAKMVKAARSSKGRSKKFQRILEEAADVDAPH